MEQEAKRLLMERLDDCLKVHADMLDAENIGAIYELQDLAELHYYLKVEHEFTPAEVEALLEFQDPLDVVRWCKEAIRPHVINHFPPFHLFRTSWKPLQQKFEKGVVIFTVISHMLVSFTLY